MQTSLQGNNTIHTLFEKKDSFLTNLRWLYAYVYV
jgi:hypothetical protein